MATLGSLVISLEANMAQFQSSLDKAAADSEAFSARVKHTMETATKALEALGIAATLHEFGHMITETLDAAEKMGKLSEKVGTSVESLSALGYSAKLSDISMEQLGGSLEKLSKNMYATANGSGSAVAAIDALGVTAKGGAAKAFADLGIQVTDATGKLKTSQAVFMEISDKFSNMENGAQKTAMAMQMFGKGGAALIPMLNDGTEAFRQQAEQAAKLGIIFTDDLVNASKKVNDNFKILSGAADGMKIKMSKDMLPALNDITEAFVNLALEKDGSTSFFEAVAEASRVAAAAIGSAWLGAKDMADGMGALMAQAFALAHGDLDMMREIGRERDAQAAKNEAQLERFQSKILEHSHIFGDGQNILPNSIHKHKKDGPDTHGNTGATQVNTDFIKSLQLMLEKTQENEYAMLRLKAKQLDVSSAAEPLITALQRANSTKVVSDYVDKMKEENQTYIDQFQLIGKNALQTELFTMALKHQHETQAMIDAAKKSGKPLDAAGEASAMAASAQAIDNDTKAIIKNYNERTSWVTGAKTAFQNYADNATNSAAQTQKVFGDALSGMENALVTFVQTGKLNFSQMADSIISDILRIAIQRQITGALTGTTLGNMLGISAHADGGFVTGGGAYLVGERGPEIFMPQGGGTVIPNHQIGGNGAGMTLMNSPVIHIDSRTDQSEVHRIVSTAVQAGNAQLVDRLQRQGSL